MAIQNILDFKEHLFTKQWVCQEWAWYHRCSAADTGASAGDIKRVNSKHSIVLTIKNNNLNCVGAKCEVQEPGWI